MIVALPTLGNPDYHSILAPLDPGQPWRVDYLLYRVSIYRCVIVRKSAGGSHSQETTRRPPARGIPASAARHVPYPARARGRGAARLRDHEGCGGALRGHGAAGAGDALWIAEAAAGGGPRRRRCRAGRPGAGRRAAALLPTDAARPIRGARRSGAARRVGACGAAQEVDWGPACMSPAAAERIYRVLLRAYPPAFRAEYGREMVLVFRDQCRDGDVRTLGFWVRVFWDVVRSAPALRAEGTRTVEVIMKLAAILTVLLGAFGILGAMNEWGAASQHAGTYVLAIVLGVAASLLLLGAGVGILLQKRQATRVALALSLVCFVAARLVFPWMSILLQLIGVVLAVGPGRRGRWIDRRPIRSRST